MIRTKIHLKGVPKSQAILVGIFHCIYCSNHQHDVGTSFELFVSSDTLSHFEKFVDIMRLYTE